MTPQELKNSILQLAIQGKLVEQRAEEGTGRELLEKILAAKNAKDAEKGKGKGRLTRSRGERGAAPTSASPRDEISDDEKPFDIPDSWEWVRLGDLVFNHGQKKPTDDFSYIDIGSIDNRRQKLSSSETIIHPQDASPRARKIVFKGDVLYATVRPYLHNICIIDREFSCEPIASTGFAVMACTPCLDNKFLFYFLLSPDFDRYANSSENAKGVAYPAISDKRLYGALIPLPPLAEQKRIVAKIEELLPLIDRYEKAWSRLESFNKSFPVDMQKSILQMAIQGKLVEQRAEEGTGRELLEKILAAKNAESTKGKGEKSHAKSAKSAKVGSRVSREEIPDDEKPFDIPESWEWVRVGDVCTNIQYGSSKKSASTGIVPVLRMGNIQNGKIDYRKLVYTSDEDEIRKYTLEVDDLLFNRTNSKELVGKVAIYKGEQSAIYAGYLVRLTPMNISADYLNYVMQSQYYWEYCQSVRSDAIGQSNINAEKLKCFVFPLPPLAEQKRIVAKLEELLPLCERLK